MSVPVRSLTSCCAELYELPIVEYLLGQSFHPGGPKLTRQLASATLVSRQSEVLDIACGNGNSARIVAADFGASVTGYDFSAINLERARAASKAANLAAKTRFVRGNAERLAFAAQSFDVALCECSLCLFGNIDSALQEIFRILKPGGRVGVSDFFLNAPVPVLLEGLLGQVLCVANAQSTDHLQQAFSRVGFQHIRVRTVNWTLQEMVSRVRQKLAVLAATTGASSMLLPESWGDPLPALAALEEFIASGGTGYLLITARKP